MKNWTKKMPWTMVFLLGFGLGAILYGTYAFFAIPLNDPLGYSAAENQQVAAKTLPSAPPKADTLADDPMARPVQGNQVASAAVLTRQQPISMPKAVLPASAPKAPMVLKSAPMARTGAAAQPFATASSQTQTPGIPAPKKERRLASKIKPNAASTELAMGGADAGSSFTSSSTPTLTPAAAVASNSVPAANVPSSRPSTKSVPVRPTDDTQPTAAVAVNMNELKWRTASHRIDANRDTTLLTPNGGLLFLPRLSWQVADGSVWFYAVDLKIQEAIITDEERDRWMRQGRGNMADAALKIEGYGPKERLSLRPGARPYAELLTSMPSWAFRNAKGGSFIPVRENEIRLLPGVAPKPAMVCLDNALIPYEQALQRTEDGKSLVKRLKAAEYAGTFVATREFWQRLRCLDLWAPNAAACIEIYLKNAHRPLYDADAMVLLQLRTQLAPGLGAERESRREYAAGVLNLFRYFADQRLETMVVPSTVKSKANGRDLILQGYSSQEASQIIWSANVQDYAWNLATTSFKPDALVLHYASFLAQDGSTVAHWATHPVLSQHTGGLSAGK